MAKKDKKKEDEYKEENLENSSAQDDEDFGLPDLDEDFDAEPVTTGTLELGLLTGAGVELEAEAGDEVVDTTEPLEVSESVFAALAT